MVILNKKFFNKILVNLKIFIKVIILPKKEIFRNKLIFNFINKTKSIIKTLKKILKVAKITKNHTKPNVALTSGSLMTKNIKMSEESHKMKVTMTIQKNINPTRSTWEISMSSRIASKDQRCQENITQQDRSYMMIIMKWMRAMKNFNTNLWFNRDHISLATHIMILISQNPIINNYMLIASKLNITVLREVLRIIHTKFLTNQQRKISI